LTFYHFEYRFQQNPVKGKVMHIVQSFENMLKNKAIAQTKLNELVMPLMQNEQLTPAQIKEHWDTINQAIENITKPFTE